MKERCEKFRPEWDSNLDLCNAGAVLYQFSFQANRELVTIRCWVCFATDEDEPMSQWVRPCRCRGTAKWVHQVCLQRWIDEKQGGSSTAKVSCPQCNAEYIIVFPPLGPLLQSVEFVDKLINKFCPIAAAGVVVGSLYWSAVTYGAVTVMQVLGHKEGLEVMEKADPMFLFVGLPTIPLALILGKMVRWEDHVLRLWRRHVGKMSFLNYILPHLTAGLATRTPAEPTPLSDPVSLTRLLCGALVLPTISTLIGKVGFGFVHSSLHRALLGGMTFVAVKGVVRIYYKQQQYVRQAQRVVKDYEPE
ncbi:PREDICTED: E3 ubiquitin-protein ligase MARCH5-like isoform X1 [Acropora digitifera]|uniref:E3 ubiquitin-protein ligase MARCH5-like isoform X1 n=1 Tax=Acropora digitifera TaxID=70779 RepID=UPI00077B0487|nr:PREDICTED: E3 ubiquitin-protein ligase MARCH5-like isoform X1 [Acropora digitifera]XP_015777130.1 PREDICTED: E3 ubiquitin-protein ligase MARCH5-like isoform X1 [Acropora digitifera]XP_015777131.1 PREDICTED: E3 ubiquitin-protein ligase MARCH5-like isoform X1 [Acropora digitifera]